MNTKLQRIFLGATFVMVPVIASCSPSTPAATLINSVGPLDVPSEEKSITWDEAVK